MLLIEAGAKSGRQVAVPPPPPSPTATCATPFRVAFVSDVAGLRSAIDAAGWRGLQDAAAQHPCLQPSYIVSAHPSDYRQNLQTAADAHSDLIIAASFLLSDAVVDAANANPQTRFVLVNPLVAIAAPTNLSVVIFREQEAGFLAGALAGLTTRTGVVAGVYGLEDDHDRAYRLGFERGTHSVNRSARVLGVYQGAQDGSPYANPEWGATAAHAFIAQRADVIFGSGDLTGQGALAGAQAAGTSCIALGLSVDPSAPACTVGTVLLRLDRALAEVTTSAMAGRWQGGERSYGVAEASIELRLSPTLSLDVQRRLRAAADLLANQKS